MTPTEKALQLCQKFGATTMFSEDNEGYTLSLENAKKCANICVDEIIFNLSEMHKNSWIDTDYYRDFRLKLEYWQSVKTEIEKL